MHYTDKEYRSMRAVVAWDSGITITDHDLHMVGIDLIAGYPTLSFGTETRTKGLLQHVVDPLFTLSHV